MKIFSAMYEMTIRWAGHRHAPWYLGGLSFAESSFFPIPPDVMLAPMAMAKREKAWRYALITTIASVLGGLFGYLVGMFAFELVEPLLHQAGYWERFQTAQQWFEEWGFWIVFVAGFSPIPYKVFTISAGTIGMALLPFLVASLIGRGARFFLVAGLIWWGGEKMEQVLKKYIDVMGIAVIIIMVVAYLVLR